MEKEKLQQGDIILVRYYLPYFAGWIIPFISGGKWAHAALYVGDGKVIEAQVTNVRQISLELLLNLDEKKAFKYGVYRAKNISRSQINKIIDYCEERLGWKYDFSAVGYLFYVFMLSKLGIKRKRGLLVNPLNKTESLFCSELVAEAFDSVGFKICDKESSLITANDISKSDKLELVLSN